MSKLRYAARSSTSASSKPATYAFEPCSPSSSAPPPGEPDLVGRRRRGAGERDRRGRIDADPLPLSLTPGLVATLSRWAPSRTTLSARPPAVSATTLNVGTSEVRSTTRTVISTGPAASAARRASPSARLSADARDGPRHRPGERAGQGRVLVLVVVVDDHGDRARHVGGLRLDGEAGTTAAHQGDPARRRHALPRGRVAAQRIAGRDEVGGLAVGIRTRRERDRIRVQRRRAAGHRRRLGLDRLLRGP